jgi:hypothetical protein
MDVYSHNHAYEAGMKIFFCIRCIHFCVEDYSHGNKIFTQIYVVDICANQNYVHRYRLPSNVINLCNIFMDQKRM